MNTTDEDSPGLVPAGDVSRDGQDPDVPRHGRSFRFPEASNLVDDLQELRQLTEADKRHYAGGSTRKREPEAHNYAR